MIGSLRGNLLENTGDTLLIEVSGVGYQLFVSGDTAAYYFDKLHSEVFLYVHTVVREDALDLYGFRNQDEKKFFQQVINISGIGPKSGLGIISVAPIEQLKSAIAAGDSIYLTKVSGVGKKSAQKVILELQDKLADELSLAGITSSDHTEDSDVMEALLSLGYDQASARNAIKDLPADATGMQTRLRLAIKSLGQT